MIAVIRVKDQMTAERVKCSNCNNQVLPETADRNAGLCGVCERKRRKLVADAEREADMEVVRYAEEFQILRRMTRDLVRSAFEDLERLCGDELIYGICIYAYHTVGPPVLCGSTLSGFAEREAKLRADTSLHQLLPDTPIQELINSTGKWSPYEWEHEAHRWADFREILDYVEALTPKAVANPANELHAMVLAAYMTSLKDLDHEGLFAPHRTKSSLVLFCSDCDSSDREWYQHASARFLNPPELFEIFYNESVLYDLAGERRNRELLGDERERRFNQYLYFATHGHC